MENTEGNKEEKMEKHRIISCGPQHCLITIPKK